MVLSARVNVYATRTGFESERHSAATCDELASHCLIRFYTTRSGWLSELLWRGKAVRRCWKPDNGALPFDRNEPAETSEMLLRAWHLRPPIDS